ncbi:MAG: hypothetical protein HYX68_04170 [Planctomycetes bacterium]|jgi:hypothetical protein|nr:hypothetical protein [Planctomycetota bacterium]
MIRGLLVGAVAVFGLFLLCDANSEGGDKKKIASIKTVMKKAMKSGLCKKVASGKASEKEKKQLIALFTDLAANKCPKGEEDSWKAKTKALLDAAKAGDGEALAKAADCGACHKAHK